VKQQQEQREAVGWTVVRWKKSEDSIESEGVALHLCSVLCNEEDLSEFVRVNFNVNPYSTILSSVCNNKATLN
jgi:hypothetical protein